MQVWTGYWYAPRWCGSSSFHRSGLRWLLWHLVWIGEAHRASPRCGLHPSPLLLKLQGRQTSQVWCAGAVPCGSHSSSIPGRVSSESSRRPAHLRDKEKRSNRTRCHRKRCRNSGQAIKTLLLHARTLPALQWMRRSKHFRKYAWLPSESTRWSFARLHPAKGRRSGPGVPFHRPQAEIHYWPTSPFHRMSCNGLRLPGRSAARMGKQC